jgi:formylglycine-generating enzyme required for sulfatase activity
MIFAVFMVCVLFCSCSKEEPPVQGKILTLPSSGKENAALETAITNSIGMKFVLIQAGEFQMGSPDNEKDRQSDEGPQHKVKITKPFYMQTTEVTQAQWKAVMGNNPSNFKGDDLPVERVCWEDAQEFIKKLSTKEGLKYRLPTEAEWEYSCRAGSTTRFCFGDDESKLGDYAWYDKNSGNKTHPVGTKKPNAWGLYDMHGNVWEWCQDWYDENYYKNSPAEDPQGPANGEFRVLRGGCWYNYVRLCRSAYRLRDVPSLRFYYDGCRLARSSE